MTKIIRFRDLSAGLKSAIISAWIIGGFYALIFSIEVIRELI